MTASRMRAGRSTFVSAALLAALLASGCAAEAPAASEEATTSAPSASSTGAVTDTPTEAEESGVKKIDGIPVKEGVVNNGRGEYIQTTIADDEAAMIYNPTKADALAKELFTEEQLQDAQAFVVRFLAEEGLDSTANGGTADDFNAWWEQHSSKMHPLTADGFYQEGLESSLILLSQWHEGKYSLAYDPADTRVKDRLIQVTEVLGGTDEASGTNFVTFRFKTAHKSPIIVEGRESAEDYTGSGQYTAALDAGEWKIAGYNISWNGVEGLPLD